MSSEDVKLAIEYIRGGCGGLCGGCKYYSACADIEYACDRFEQMLIDIGLLRSYRLKIAYRVGNLLRKGHL